MARYLRLWLHFVRFSFSKALQFRLDFCFRFAMDLCYYAMHLAFFHILYRHTLLLGGWTLDEALVFIAGYFVVDALHMTLYASNMWMFPLLVNKGDLDGYLVRPVSSLFFVSFREFAANSFLNLLCALGILGWALARFPGGFTAPGLALYAVLLLLGVFLFWCLQMCFLIPVFWMHSNRGLGDTFFAVSSAMNRPDRIYTGWARRVFVGILPFAVIASFPARTFLEGLDAGLLLHMLAASAGAFLAMLWMWRAGLRAYASASS